MAMEASAATRYVMAAHFSASFAISFSAEFVMLVVPSQVNALAEASNSTGKVIIENNVVTAKRMIPMSSIVGFPPPKP